MWNEIQPGQILLTKHRIIRVGRRIIFTEWKQHVVDSVSKVFYVVEGEKYRKEHCGKQFMNNFYFPGVDDAPLTASATDEYEELLQKAQVISSLHNIVRVDLDNIADINKAAELAVKLKAVLDEIEAQPKL